MSNNFEKVGPFIDKDIVLAVQKIVDNCEFLTSIKYEENFDFDKFPEATLNFKWLVQRDRT